MTKPVLRFLRLAAIPLCVLAFTLPGSPARTCEQTGFCIAYTEYNPETCQCECMDEACCLHYGPWVAGCS